MNNQKNRIGTRFFSGWAGWMLLFVGLWLCSVSGWSQTQGYELTGKAREKNIERIEKQLKDFYDAWLGACVDEDPDFIEAIGKSYVAPNGVFKPDFGKFPEDGLWEFEHYCSNFRKLYQSMYEEPLEFRQSDFRFIYLKSVDGGNSVEADFTFQSKLYSGERLITSAEVEAVMLIDAYSPTNYKLRQIVPTQPVTIHYSPEGKSIGVDGNEEASTQPVAPEEDKEAEAYVGAESSSSQVFIWGGSLLLVLLLVYFVFRLKNGRRTKGDKEPVPPVSETPKKKEQTLSPNTSKKVTSEQKELGKIDGHEYVDLGLSVNDPPKKKEQTLSPNTSKKVTSEQKEWGKIDGHEYVDLGLSVKWATCNVGASSPSDYGDYFAWGEIKPKKKYTEENSVTWEKNIGDIGGNPQYDAARANWGGSWRLPTQDELMELKEKCTWIWTTQDGHKGYKVKGPNGKSIFLPAAGWRYGTSLYNVGEDGYYWSSSPFESNTQDAYSLNFDSSDYDWYWYDRYYGHSVRPVLD